MSAAHLNIATYQRQAMRARHYSKSKEKVSASTQNQAVNALKLFYKAEYIRDIGQVVSLRPKKEYKLPNILSQQEVQAILSSFTNSKTQDDFLFDLFRWA